MAASHRARRVRSMRRKVHRQPPCAHRALRPQGLRVLSVRRQLRVRSVAQAYSARAGPLLRHRARAHPSALQARLPISPAFGRLSQSLEMGRRPASTARARRRLSTIPAASRRLGAAPGQSSGATTSQIRFVLSVRLGAPSLRSQEVARLVFSTALEQPRRLITRKGWEPTRREMSSSPTTLVKAFASFPFLPGRSRPGFPRRRMVFPVSPLILRVMCTFRIKARGAF